MNGSDRLHLRAGSSTSGDFDVLVTPESAGWGHTSLHVASLTAGRPLDLPGGPDERVVVPLTGSLDVHIEDPARPDSGASDFHLEGRTDVFAGPTDVVYVPTGSTLRLRSDGDARVAICGARAQTHFPARHIPADEALTMTRGAGDSSRLVRNFGTTDALEADSIIACEVITPAGNWSSYPAHKHDEDSPGESILEEIYYYEFTDGPDGQPGFGYHQTSSSPAGPAQLLVEVRRGDVVLVPHGWHGPCVAPPGYDMYYLNVMAGPGPRFWGITDHPDQAWVRGSWQDESVDPRVADGR